MDQRSHHHWLGVKENTLKTNRESDSARVNPHPGIVRIVQQLFQWQCEAVGGNQSECTSEMRINPNSFKGALLYFSAGTHSSRCIYSTSACLFPTAQAG